MSLVREWWRSVAIVVLMALLGVYVIIAADVPLASIVAGGVMVLMIGVGVAVACRAIENDHG